MALTGKKKAFAEALLLGKTNREAAVAAGYSEKTASAAGCRLAKDEDVKAHVKARRINTPPDEPVAPPPRPFDINVAILHADPKAFLLAAMNDPALEDKHRIEAAKTLMPFVHQKLGEGGKKDQKQAAAEKVASRFGQAPAPRLAAAGGKKV